MAEKKTIDARRPYQSCEHRNKLRLNSLSMELVTPQTAQNVSRAKKTYSDPHTAVVIERRCIDD